MFINSSCTDVLTTGHLSNFHITDDGVVFLMLANGCSYSYSKQLESWLVVNSRDPIVRIGVAAFVQSQSKNMRTFPLNTVQSMQHNQLGGGRGFQDRFEYTTPIYIYLIYIVFMCHSDPTTNGKRQPNLVSSKTKYTLPNQSIRPLNWSIGMAFWAFIWPNTVQRPKCGCCSTHWLACQMGPIKVTTRTW